MDEKELRSKTMEELTDLLEELKLKTLALKDEGVDILWNREEQLTQAQNDYELALKELERRL